MPTVFYQPYTEHGANYLYNLLFCDNLTLFHKKDGPLAQVLSPDINREDLDRIGNSLEAEARVRVLAFNRLRSSKTSVPRRRHLGTIVEVHYEKGLDVLAGYVDGRIRYINFTGKLVICETPPQQLTDKNDELMRMSQMAINQLSPCTTPRRTPPQRGMIRMTFLASDGPYIGEATLGQLRQDRFAKPVIDAAEGLLKLVVTAALTNGKDINTIRRAS
jgi:hypothetical protein